MWSWLLRVTLDEELATAEGVPTRLVRVAFMLFMALAVAIGMKIVGILLIVALLVIPPAVARQFARTPEQMAGLAALAGALAVLGGLGASLMWDTPAGPSIVVAATLLFLVSLAAHALRARPFARPRLISARRRRGASGVCPASGAPDPRPRPEGDGAGWGGRIRTCECRIQSPIPTHYQGFERPMTTRTSD